MYNRKDRQVKFKNYQLEQQGLETVMLSKNSKKENFLTCFDLVLLRDLPDEIKRWVYRWRFVGLHLMPKKQVAVIAVAVARNLLLGRHS